VAPGHGLERRPQEVGVEAEAPPGWLIGAAAGMAGLVGDAEEEGRVEAGVHRGAERGPGAGAEARAVHGASEGLGSSRAADDGGGVVRVRDDLELEIDRERFCWRRRLHGCLSR
jgi:hypothetical protein